MSTITLYKDKLNGAGGLIDKIIKSSNNIDVQLGTLKSTLQGVDSSTCNLQDTVDSISSSSKSHKEKVEDLKKLNRKLNDFIDTTVKRDNSARDQINKEKKDFYSKYKYLKPDCEKSRLEKIKDKIVKAGKWCREHWKEIVAAIVVITGIVLCFVPGCQWLGAQILIGALKGALSGFLIGGISSWASGGSFWAGAKEGMLSGIIFGGGLAGLGAGLGSAFCCCEKFVKATRCVAKFSGIMAMGMNGFDMLSLGSQLLFGDNFITDLNKKLHSSKAYNIFQAGINAVSIISSGAVKGIEHGKSIGKTCFIAGTMVMTSAGLIAIEKIEVDDMVLSADVSTMQVSYKKVLETYIRKVNKLIHLIINGETIVTTADHPFFVKGMGFINAADLTIGFELVNQYGEVLNVEQIFREDLDDETVDVYNFQVDEYHTYYVGYYGVLVHNADNYTAKSGSSVPLVDRGTGNLCHT